MSGTKMKQGPEIKAKLGLRRGRLRSGWERGQGCSCGSHWSVDLPGLCGGVCDEGWNILWNVVQTSAA